MLGCSLVTWYQVTYMYKDHSLLTVVLHICLLGRETLQAHLFALLYPLEALASTLVRGACGSHRVALFGVIVWCGFVSVCSETECVEQREKSV